MISLLLLHPARLAQTPASEPLVAYAARYYRQKGKSHDQIYVCRLDGSGRRQITDGSEDCSGVRWAGPHRLIWFTQQDERIRKWTMAYPNGKPTSEWLPGDNWHLHESFADFSPDHAILDHSDDPNGIDPATGKIVPAPALNPLGIVTTFQDQSGGASVNGKEFKWSFKESSLVLTEGDKRWEFPFEDGVVTAHWEPARSNLWVREWTHDSTSGGHTSLYRMDFKIPKPIKVIDDAGRLDFWPTRDVYAYAKPRDLAPLGKKQVWVSPLIVGRQSTGKQKAIVSGLVWVLSVSLRP